MNRQALKLTAAILTALLLCLICLYGRSQDNDKSNAKATIVEPVSFGTGNITPNYGQVSDTVKPGRHVIVLNME